MATAIIRCLLVVYARPVSERHLLGRAGPDRPADETDGGRAEVDNFLADVAGRPEAEQRKAFDSLVAQLPPGAAAGDPLRARRILVAALCRDPGPPREGAVYDSLLLASPEKSAPIIVEVAIGSTGPDDWRALNMMDAVMDRTGRSDLFRDILPLLRKAVLSDDKNLRYGASPHLTKFGEEGIPTLLAMSLASREPRVRGPAPQIAQYADIVLPVLQDALKGSDPTRRRNALFLLEPIAPEGPETVPLLLPLLDDKDPATCREAAFALGLYGDAARAAVPRLLKLIVADDPTVRYQSAEALGRIGIAADQIENLWPGVLRIEETGNNYSWFYPYGYAAASPGRAAVPELIRGLSHPDRRVRRAAAYACAYLGPIAGAAAIPLLKAASDPDHEAASGAMWALDNLGSAAAAAIDGLAALLEQSKWGPPNIIGNFGIAARAQPVGPYRPCGASSAV